GLVSGLLCKLSRMRLQLFKRTQTFRQHGRSFHFGPQNLSIEIPEVLRPKMKGSTVLAKSLRALEKLQPHPTELAEQARDQAQELLDQHRCAQP
ncbi:hypothetical protein, partial [Rothia dentocariosa]|uniref:hypothetical protein n=1 Tax=Rothia dentocariosa TaxID=2047 RepID=UPI003C756100